MKKLYFVRHGESQANAEGRFAGRWDVPLTDKGRKQAKLAGQDAVQLRLDRIVSSPLKRAKETTEIIASEINYPVDEIIYSDLLEERDYGDLQGKSWDGIGDIDFDLVPNVETTEELIERAKKAADFLRAIDADNLLVVGHGTFGRALRDQILKQDNDIEVSMDQEMPNSRIIEWL